jgi:membrane associated rhomboid family serine protease
MDGTNITATGGASGAVFGLMGAAAVGMHRRGINIFSTGIGGTLLLNLVFTFTISGVSIGGHVGGVLAGALCGWFMLAPTWTPSQKWVGYVTPTAVGLACAAGAYWACTSLPVFTG